MGGGSGRGTRRMDPVVFGEEVACAWCMCMVHGACAWRPPPAHRIDPVVLGEEVGLLRAPYEGEQLHVGHHERGHRADADEGAHTEEIVQHRHRDEDLERRRPEQVLEVGRERGDRLDVHLRAARPRARLVSKRGSQERVAREGRKRGSQERVARATRWAAGSLGGRAGGLPRSG